MIYCMLLGLLGALMMFSGDMLLYYDSNDFDYRAGDGVESMMRAIIDVMKNVSDIRLTCGGLIGPIASFFYCVGFYHIVAITEYRAKLLSVIAFAILCFGIIVGGAYHSHCAYLGLLGEEKSDSALDIVRTYFQRMELIFYSAEGIGFILLAGLILTGHTLLPRWMCMVSPGVLFLLKPFVVRLPKGIRIIISGGWSNLISVIYYAACIVWFVSCY